MEAEIHELDGSYTEIEVMLNPNLIRGKSSTEIHDEINEFVVVANPNMHIIIGKCIGGDNYRAEIHEIDDEYSEYIFGTIPNIDDYYIFVSRYKLYINPLVKVIYIIDVCGYSFNLDAINFIESYDMNTIDNEYNDFKLCNKALSRLYVDWEIRRYTSEDMYIFQLCKKIFHDVIQHSEILEEKLGYDIIQKIKDINFESFNILDTKWHYSILEMDNLWNKCVETYTDQGMVALWFDLERDAKVFEMI
jgi:hypothetical protein